jgi:hypothetical protein
MKTKTFLLTCLLLGFGLNHLSAQNATNGTGSDVVTVARVGWGCPVYCDGVNVDYLWGVGEAHFIDHFIDGVWQWETIIIKGIGRNAAGEKFSFSEQDKIFYSHKLGDYSYTAHDNIKARGEHNTLYNISLIINPYDVNIFEVKNATCTGNSGY